MPTTEIADPDGNTGLVLQGWDIKCDWLNLTCRFPTEESVKECFAEIAYSFGEEFGLVWTPEKGLNKGKYYAHTAHTVHGTKFAWNRCVDGMYEVWVSIPGRVLSRVPSIIQLRIFKMLRSRYGFSPTRFDIALDDYEKMIPKEMVLEALDEGNFVGFRSYSLHENGLKGRGRKDGWTVNFGSRQSDKYYRYYDKSSQSNGEIDSYRWEVELKDYKAKQVWDLLAHVSDGEVDLFESILLEVIIGGIDFKDLKADSNQTRCPRLDWWEFYIERLKSPGGIKLGSRRCKSSLEKTVTWVKHQVETSLAMLRDVLGSQKFHAFMSDCIDSGRMRYGKQHEAILRLHRNGYDTLEVQLC